MSGVVLHPGCRVRISDQPRSLTVAGHEGEEAEVLEATSAEIVLVGIEGMGRVGHRQVFVEDLEPVGTTEQLRLL